MTQAAQVSAFDLFWTRYPRRVAKKEARKAWEQLNPSPQTVEEIMDALVWQAPMFLQRDQDKIPHAATWLRGERWTDEPMTKPKRHADDWGDECRRLHGGTCESRYQHALKAAS